MELLLTLPLLLLLLLLLVPLLKFNRLNGVESIAAAETPMRKQRREAYTAV
jgi:hypothetical protein